MAKEKIISVFVDESGDFGNYSIKCPYYVVSMILHDQSIDISKEISYLDSKIESLGFPNHAVHMGPLIRRESIYQQYEDYEMRVGLLNAIYHFTRQLKINYICPIIKKSECPDFLSLNSKLSREIYNSLNKHSDYLNSFDRIIVYYDNGQNELTKILTSVFSILFPNVEFRKVKPADYKLFQVADLVCTWELLALKAEKNEFTESEKDFFDSPREFKRNRLKLIRNKKLD